MCLYSCLVSRLSRCLCVSLYSRLIWSCILVCITICFTFLMQKAVKLHKYSNEYQRIFHLCVENWYLLCLDHCLMGKKNEKNERKNSRKKKRNIWNVLLLDHFHCSVCGHTTLPSFSPKNNQPKIHNIWNLNTKKRNHNQVHNGIAVHKINIEVQRNEP